MTDQKPSPEPEYTPQETAALEAEIDAFLAMGHHFAGTPPRQTLMRAIGIIPDANERGLTVEMGHIDPAAVPLSEILKLGPNAGLLADLTDSLFSAPPPTA